MTAAQGKGSSVLVAGRNRSERAVSDESEMKHFSRMSHIETVNKCNNIENTVPKFFGFLLSHLSHLSPHTRLGDELSQSMLSMKVPYSHQ